MKKIAVLIIFLSSLFSAVAFADQPIDSLKQQLQVTTADSAKADIYTRLANCYLDFSTVPNGYTKRVYQENAINYTMLALHLYSKRADTTGLKMSYSNLSKAYRSKHNFAQAKWFILQANTLSRQQKSVKDIIATLVDLAAIKIDIRDYNLAQRDLNEALKLSLLNNVTDQDSTIKQGFSRLYTFKKVSDEENIFVNANLLKASTYATIKPKKQSAVKGKKTVAAKKKIYMVADKKVYDNKIVSL